MKIDNGKPYVVVLSLGCLLATACDKDDEDMDLGGTTTAVTTGEDPTTSGDPTTGEDPTGGAETETATATDGVETEGQTDACEAVGDSRACVADDGREGTQFCDDFNPFGSSDLHWGPCVTFVACTPGETNCCDIGDTDTDGDGSCQFTEQCNLYDGVPGWNTEQEEFAGCATPLVLSFDGHPARMSPARAATFDLDGIGGCITTDWPEATTPWLALDRDASGSIESGRELFGSGTRLRSGARPPHGCAALAELDDNGDGRIDARDPGFDALVLWGDHDGDRRSTFAETELLSQRRVLSIELGYHVERHCDSRGNCGVERASFHYVDEHGAVQQGEVVDLHLACQ